MLARRAFAEFVGTAMLLVAVVGSGIAAQRLSPGDTGLQLFENAAATAVALVAIILAVGAVSGAHLNPIITLADRVYGALTNREASVYVGAQFVGAATGTMIANVMFDLSLVEISDQARTGGGVLFGEVVATFGLVLVVFGVAASGRVAMAPFAVGAYIGGAYLFTSSTSFANPAVTVARSLTDSFTGIEPSAVPAFVLMQLLGGAVAVVTVLLLYPSVRRRSSAVVVPHLDPHLDPEVTP